MKFQFCGQQDCPDWILSEIFILSRLSSVKAKLFAAQVVQSILKGLSRYFFQTYHWESDLWFNYNRLFTCLDGESEGSEGSKELPDMDKLAKLSSDAKFSHADILAASAALAFIVKSSAKVS